MATATSPSPVSESSEAWALIQELMTSKDPLRPLDQNFAALHRLGSDFRGPDGTHVIVSHEGVTQLFLSELFTKTPPGADRSPRHPPMLRLTAEQAAELEEIDEAVTPLLGKLDGSAHKNLRGLVQASFMPRHLNAIREMTAVTARTLAEGLDPRRPVDINAAFGALFAPEIVGALIGLPAEHRLHVSGLTAIYMRGGDPAGSFEARRDGLLASREQRAYIRGVIADVRKTPRDDLVTGLVRAADAGSMSEIELVRLLQILYIGGYETTAHMVGNGLAVLLRHRDQFERLIADPSLLRNAIEEMLRWDGPISYTYVFAQEGAEIAGLPAETGRQYLGLIRAANRDPRRFESPDRFDITRRTQGIMSFGTGPHHCLGVNLARMELTVAFTELFRRFPRMELADAPLRRSPTFQQQSYEKVMVVLEP
jgi:cytochrome P450